MQAHHRPQIDFAHGVGRGMEAVSRNARTDHIHRVLGAQNRRAGVAAVTDLWLNALGLHKVQHVHKALMLKLRKRHVLRLFGVGDAEVHENTFNIEIRQLGDFDERSKRGLRLVGEEAEARHAGIDLQMDGQLFPRSLERFVEVLCVLQAVHLLRDSHFRLVGRKLRGRIPENQNRQVHAAAAQLHSLFQIGNGQILRAQLLERPADLYGAVSIGVRLHNAEESRPFSNVLTQRLVVMLQIVQRDISPCSFEYFHCLSLPFVN